ncbi:MAG: aminotransferase class III-fold pyridoxal phosphate-dependent enzyme, partial [Psychrosphaera sp.]|nr:aminotransferase class III-fold pyridoxal phosphate-dependent enzyme [Psychrosphaera sp.]
MFALLDSSLGGLLQVLNGQIKYVEALFPAGSMDLVEDVYKNNVILRQYSQKLALAVAEMAAAVNESNHSRPLRSLEIGSGTGGTSEFVFKALRGLEDKVSYTYTDISGGFLQYGKKTYGVDYPYIEFKTLNIENDPAEQGFDYGQYDIIFASNVIHATSRIANTLANIKKLLSAQGVLMLNETTRVLNFTSLTFGLADGWWLYQDGISRLPYSPLLTPQSWQALQTQAGLCDFKAIAADMPEVATSLQHLMIAKSDGKVEQTPASTQVAIKPKRMQRTVVAGSELQNQITAIVGEASGLSQAQLDPQMNLFELGLDSLMLMSVKEGIHKAFSVSIDTSEFYERADTLAKITELVAGQVGSVVEDVVENIAEPKPVKSKKSRQADDKTKPHLRGFLLKDKPLSKQKTDFVGAFIKRYNQRTSKSQQYAVDTKQHCADWINSLGFRPTLKPLIYPVVMSHCYDARFVDIDGNDYLDFGMGYGVSFFGNKVDFIQQAIQTQLDKGFELGPQNHLAGEVARLISDMTGVERVSFCNTGSEAVMVALRLARTVTKRDKIVIFAGAYHGTFDGVLATVNSTGIGAARQVVGTPEAMMDDVIVLNYGDEKSLDIIRELGDELAAVLVEPVQSRNPALQPKAFLDELREITAQKDICLIFDEVLLGFRIAQGGAQQYFGIQADLVTYGKVAGGGLPLGIVAGKKSVMDSVDGGYWSFDDDSHPYAETTVFQGTFCKHPLTMAAAHAVLSRMKQQGPQLQQGVNALTDKLALKVNDFFASEQLPIKLVHFGSVFRFDTFAKLNPLLQPIEMDLFYNLLLEQGIYTWEKRICFLSTKHTEVDIDCFVEAIKRVIGQMKAAGFLVEQSIEMPASSSTTTSYIASSAQKRMYFLQSLEQGNSPYQLTAAFD